MGWDGGEVKANVFIAGALGGLSALRCGCGGARPSHSLAPVRPGLRLSVARALTHLMSYFLPRLGRPRSAARR